MSIKIHIIRQSFLPHPCQLSILVPGFFGCQRPLEGPQPFWRSALLQALSWRPNFAAAKFRRSNLVWLRSDCLLEGLAFLPDGSEQQNKAGQFKLKLYRWSDLFCHRFWMECRYSGKDNYIFELIGVAIVGSQP